MILDFTQPAEALWQQVQVLKKRLQQFAQLSLIDSQSEKDQFLSDCHNLVSQLHWDSIAGGCYLVDQNTAIYSTRHNLILAEFLLAAGRTFFDGEFIYLSERIMQATVGFMFKDNKPLIKSQVSFPIEQSPFNLKKENLSCLEPKEIKLLAALLKTERFLSGQYYWISYRVSLSKAAEKAGIHYKQAQILEQSLRTKLLEKNQSKYNQAIYHCSAELDTCQQVLSTTIHTILWNRNEVYQALAEELKKLLVNRLIATVKLNASECVYVCYGLLKYCQTNFDNELLGVIQQKLQGFKAEPHLSKKCEVLLFRSISILRQLNFLPKDEGLNELFQSLSNKIDNDFLPKVVLLSTSNLEREEQKQALLSTYDPQLLVYQPA